MKRIITIATLCCLANSVMAAERENTHLKAVTDSIAAEREAYLNRYAPDAPGVSWTDETCAGNKDVACKNADSAWGKYADKKTSTQILKETMVQGSALQTSKTVQKYVADRTKEKQEYLKNNVPPSPAINWSDTTCYKDSNLKCEKPNATWDSVVKPATSP